MDDYKHIAWCDIETTGLDPQQHVPVEIAIVLTDLDLGVLGERSWLVLPHFLDILRLDPKVREMHNENGLFRDLFDAQNAAQQTTNEWGCATYLSGDQYEAVPERPPDNELIGNNVTVDSRIDHWLRYKLGIRYDEKIDRRLALGGSGVSHFEARWLPIWFPQFNRWLHHSTIDVGVMRRFIEKVANRPKIVPAATQDKPHRALDDVKLHIREGRKYRNVIAKYGTRSR